MQQFEVNYSQSVSQSVSQSSFFRVSFLVVDSCIGPQYGDGEKPNAGLRFSPKHFRVASSFLSCELEMLANPQDR